MLKRCTSCGTRATTRRARSLSLCLIEQTLSITQSGFKFLVVYNITDKSLLASTTYVITRVNHRDIYTNLSPTNSPRIASTMIHMRHTHCVFCRYNSPCPMDPKRQMQICNDPTEETIKSEGERSVRVRKRSIKLSRRRALPCRGRYCASPPRCQSASFCHATSPGDGHRPPVRRA